MAVVEVKEPIQSMMFSLPDIWQLKSEQEDCSRYFLVDKDVVRFGTSLSLHGGVVGQFPAIVLLPSC